MPLIFNIIESKYALSVDFRQDFQAQRFAWGWDIRMRGKRPRFKVNELDIQDEDTEFNIFVETTRFFGLKSNVTFENIFDLTDTRDRTVFVGERDLSAVDFREFRTRQRSFRISFNVSGSF